MFMLYKMIQKKWKLTSIAFLFAIGITPNTSLNAQQYYKYNTGFLLQKIEPVTHSFNIRFKYGFVLPYFFGFYIVDIETLQDYFSHDSVDYEHAIMLCDPVEAMFADSAITRDVKRHTRIRDVLSLDDSEVYQIGGDKYIIRHIQYAYYDNSEVKVYMKGFNYYMWSDISDEDTAEFNATYEVGQLYGRDYYQCYHHLITILPTPPQIQKNMWKKLYELAGK